MGQFVDVEWACTPAVTIGEQGSTMRENIIFSKGIRLKDSSSRYHISLEYSVAGLVLLHKPKPKLRKIPTDPCGVLLAGFTRRTSWCMMIPRALSMAFICV